MLLIHQGFILGIESLYKGDLRGYLVDISGDNRFATLKIELDLEGIPKKFVIINRGCYLRPKDEVIVRGTIYKEFFVDVFDKIWMECTFIYNKTLKYGINYDMINPKMLKEFLDMEK